MPAVELHQQLGSAVKVQLVELDAALDVFVGGVEEEEVVVVVVTVMAEGEVSAPGGVSRGENRVLGREIVDREL